MASLGQIIFCSMITVIIILAAAIILILAVSLTGQTAEVMSNNKIPLANLGSDELLSCYINSESKDTKFIEVSVTWTKVGLTGNVYEYEDGGPVLRDQNPQFRGRAQLFPDALLQGNGSLLLKNVNQRDVGEYTCSISSSSGHGKVNIHLRAAAFVPPKFEIFNRTLTAKATRWFPEPNVTWSDFEGNILNGNTKLSKNSAGIFSVVSTIQPVNISDSYTCTIENELVTVISVATVNSGTDVSENTYFIYSAASPLLASTYLSFMTSIICICFLT